VAEYLWLAPERERFNQNRFDTEGGLTLDASDGPQIDAMGNVSA